MLYLLVYRRFSYYYFIIIDGSSSIVIGATPEPLCCCAVKLTKMKLNIRNKFLSVGFCINNANQWVIEEVESRPWLNEGYMRRGYSLS